jgi:hypothetical protein
VRVRVARGLWSSLFAAGAFPGVSAPRADKYLKTKQKTDFRLGVGCCPFFVKHFRHGLLAFDFSRRELIANLHFVFVCVVFLNSDL